MACYRLRWRFEYADGKPPRVGHWSRSSKDPDEMAAFVSKENLAFALIEGEDMTTWEVKTLASCYGPDFCNFEWIAGAAYGLGSGYTFHELIGLKIRGRDKTTSVYYDGSVFEADRSEADKQLHLAGYGK